MKKIFVLLALFATFGISNLHAQKKLLVVDYFQSEEQTEQHIEEVRNQVINGIQATNRLQLIDAYTELSLQVEDRSLTRLQIIQNLGASYILIGNIDNLTIERKQLEDGGGTYFTADLKVTLKFIEPSTGELYATKTLTTHGGGMLFGAGATVEKAVSAAISGISNKLKRVIDEHFPLKGMIVELNEVKKNKLISCYVNIGASHGVAKGQMAKVMLSKVIAGRQTLSEIGRLRFEEIVADDLSECKIAKGQEEILAAINSGSEVFVESMGPRFNLDLE